MRKSALVRAGDFCGILGKPYLKIMIRLPKPSLKNPRGCKKSIMILQDINWAFFIWKKLRQNFM